MKRPFSVLPSKAYKNDQFQVVSKVDDLKIDIFYGDRVIKSLRAKSDYPVLLTDLGFTGEFMAKCIINGQHFEQEIVVEEALRLGSSEFKKAFLFDDTNYSFFLMQDRLLIYDEDKEVLLTENHYSPTDIRKISNTKFLFITKLGAGSSGIVNLGIYDLETFSMVGELMNTHSELAILPEANKAWLLQKEGNEIDCFELYHDTGRCFALIKSFEVNSGYLFNPSLQRIIINGHEKVMISDLHNLHKSFEIEKSDNVAIDQDGNLYSKEGSKLTYRECFSEITITINIDLELNLVQKDFLHVGQYFKTEFEITDFTVKAEALKSQIVSTLDEKLKYFYHPLPESEWLAESHTIHNIYPTKGGVFIFQKTFIREFNGVSLKKNNDIWNVKSEPNERIEHSLIFFNSRGKEVLIENTYSISNIKYQHYVLHMMVNSENKIFVGKEQMSLAKESTYQVIKAERHSYLIVKTDNHYTVFELVDKIRPLFKNIEISNERFLNEHKIIWYYYRAPYAKAPNQLHAYDLKSRSRIPLNNEKVQELLSDEITTAQFFEDYALSSKQVIFNPIFPQIKNAVVGKVKEVSKELNKVLTYRDNLIYLSSFDGNSQSYKLTEIPIQVKKYKESYLAPNGKFLVLQEETDKYLWFDIEKNETINFFSGSFLAFKNDGSLIIEDDTSRAVKIIDPLSFQDITPANYSHFRFLSPDGKLYAQIASKSKYFNKLTGEEISRVDYLKFKSDFDEPNIFEKNVENARLLVERNRKLLYHTFEQKLNELQISNYNQINSFNLINIKKYTEIGIVGTNVIAEIYFPDDLVYYNYSAFSFDNRYFGYVGKPSMNGLIHLFKIHFDEKNEILEVRDSYLSRYPKLASWVCGFSKTGYFATYDSTPNTYILSIDDGLFENKINESEIRSNIFKFNKGLYSTHKEWNEIKRKNFLCFSPSGNYLALSEQGYEPLTLGGYGHQESNAVHIAETTSGKVVKSFLDHGDEIRVDFKKKVQFVAFSEDEKRLMTMSKDGVVIVRDINIEQRKDMEKLSKAQDSKMIDI